MFLYYIGSDKALDMSLFHRLLYLLQDYDVPPEKIHQIMKTVWEFENEQNYYRNRNEHSTQSEFDFETKESNGG